MLSSKNDIREVFRVIRENKGLSLKQLAFLAGISPDHYRAFEKGRKRMTLEKIERVADALNIEIVPVPRDWKREL